MGDSYFLFSNRALYRMSRIGNITLGQEKFTPKVSQELIIWLAVCVLRNYSGFNDPL